MRFNSAIYLFTDCKKSPVIHYRVEYRPDFIQVYRAADGDRFTLVHREEYRAGTWPGKSHALTMARYGKLRYETMMRDIFKSKLISKS